MVGSIYRLKKKIPLKNQFFAVRRSSLKLRDDATHWMERDGLITSLTKQSQEKMSVISAFLVLDNPGW